MLTETSFSCGAVVRTEGVTPRSITMSSKICKGEMGGGRSIQLSYAELKS
jgi:hypothetical protein